MPQFASPSPARFRTEGGGSRVKLTLFLSVWPQDSLSTGAEQVKSGLLLCVSSFCSLLCSIQPALYVNYLLWTTEYLKCKFMGRLGEKVFQTKCSRDGVARLQKSFGAASVSLGQRLGPPGTPRACLAWLGDLWDPLGNSCSPEFPEDG